ncbi:MAG: helix-turn-helix transcriptional regulator [Oscillospiraceae bacterium]
MDLIKIGKFIAQLRYDNNMTQEELGEKLGVTNKTISRWENGNYMPSIEMLQMLSKEFAVSINELICGEKIVDSDFRQKADDTIVEVLKNNTFSVKEKYDFWKKKWLSENKFLMIISAIIIICIYFCGTYFNKPIVVGADIILALVAYCVIRNKMMGYIEQNIYGSDK